MITKPRRPMPDDFRDVAPTMTKTAMTRHYATKIDTIKRWLAEADIEAAAPVYVRPPSSAKRFTGYKHKFGNTTQTRSMTAHDDAADILRRERFPVNRCDEKGAFAQAGDFWRVGWSVLTPDELMLRADKYRRRAA